MILDYTNLPLKNASEEWTNEYNKLLEDPYISTKYNRNKRIKDKSRYINFYQPEILMGDGNVFDIGCGPGEYLEICRYYGNKIQGVDAIPGKSDMGNEYLNLSKLLTERQKIPVDYCGFDTMLKNGRIPFENKSLTFINSQGSIEMVFNEYMVGPPMVEHRNSSLIEWNITQELKDLFDVMFSEFRRTLVLNGFCMIYGNECKNQEDYNNLFLNRCEKHGFTVVSTNKKTLHKIRKL